MTLHAKTDLDRDAEADAMWDAACRAFDSRPAERALRALPMPDNDGMTKAISIGMTAAALQSMTFPPVKWVVPDYIAEGVTVLAGKPKLGKSWLALDIALAVAKGGYCLGDRHCPQGAVLYAALEDTARRLHRRIDAVHGNMSQEPWPEALTLWPIGGMSALEMGGLDQVRDWIGSVANPRLVIVDTFAKVRGPGDRGEGAYERDYREMGSIKALADETGVSILVITHVRKMGADDPFDTVSGTLGITGAADATLVLTRDGMGVTLHGTGRDIEPIEAAMEWQKDTCRWRVLGEAGEVRRSDERSAILDALRDSTEPLTSRDIADLTDQSDGNVRRMLAKMVLSAEVTKVSRGKYLHPDMGGNNGNIGNNGDKVTEARE